MRVSLSVPLCCVLNVSSCASPPTDSPSALRVYERPRSGQIEVEGGRVYYEVAGTGTGTPLLVLHGGPAIPHDYLANLAELGDDRPVVFYDQLGCGRSERPDNDDLWTVERFVTELTQVRTALGLDEVVVYGHSWGSMLAMRFMDRHPDGVKGLILAGPALDAQRWVRDTSAMVDALDPASRDAIRRAEQDGSTDSPEYQAAMGVFYRKHVCRLDPWPDLVNKALETMNPHIYELMWGPSEFHCTGTLANFDATPSLPSLTVPTLVIGGEFDEATPASVRDYASLIPGASAVIIPDASHLANHDQPAAYLAALRRFMRQHDL